jgi:tellurite methyltransferase
MSAEDRIRWDKIYRERKGKPYPPPDPLLYEVVPPPLHPESRALDFASGMGQNGLWMASQGYIVDLMDISREALAIARGEMAMRNLRNVNLLQMDVEEVELEEARYDVVCVFRYLKRDLLPQLAKTIKPGGRIIYETYNLSYLSIVPGFNVDFLLQSGELQAVFSVWQILLDNEQTHVSQFVAVKPVENTQPENNSPIW